VTTSQTSPSECLDSPAPILSSTQPAPDPDQLLPENDPLPPKSSSPSADIPQPHAIVLHPDPPAPTKAETLVESSRGMMIMRAIPSLSAIMKSLVSGYCRVRATELSDITNITERFLDGRRDRYGRAQTEVQVVLKGRVEKVPVRRSSRIACRAVQHYLKA
jgi:hypothetical protein